MNKYTSESQLTVGKWYCCMFIPEVSIPGIGDEAGLFFKYLGENFAEVDSNAIGEPNEFSTVPFGDYYIDL